LRLFETARRIATGRVISAEAAGDSLIEDLQLGDLADARAVGDQLEVEAAVRAPIDRGWVAAFLVTLFAIHGGRMGGDWSLSGLTGPAAAVLGDVVIAILFTMGAMLPVHLVLQRFSHPLERRLWRWWAAAEPQRLADGLFAPACARSCCPGCGPRCSGRSPGSRYPVRSAGACVSDFRSRRLSRPRSRSGA
jgi:hypothetical protein